jgi:hypothetical protein
MKTKLIWIFLLGTSVAFSSCDQTEVSPTDEVSYSQIALLSVSSSASADSGTTTTTAPFGRKCSLTEVSTSSLPAAITAYIATNYAEASLEGAAKTSKGAYLVYIKKADGTYAALAFDASGNFVAVNAKKAMPVDLASLPATITAYVASNYSGATIEQAQTDANGNYLVALKKADGTYVGAAFSAAGAFIQEVSFSGKLGCGSKTKKKGTTTTTTTTNN